MLEREESEEITLELRMRLPTLHASALNALAKINGIRLNDVALQALGLGIPLAAKQISDIKSSLPARESCTTDENT